MFSQNANMIDINDTETLEDLQVGGLKIIQKKDGFRFGVDAILLANFAKDIKADKIMDICTGSAIVPILLSYKSKAKELFGIEIQKEIFETAKRSVELNGLQEKITLINEDLKNAEKVYGKRVFDLVTCNPPYMPAGSAVQNEADTKIIARHEIMCTLDDIIRVSSQIMKQTGRFALVHKPTRLVDIMCTMRKHNIEPKRIRFVHKAVGSVPSLVLVEGLFKGGKELKIMPPLYLYNEDGTETEELKRIYER